MPYNQLRDLPANVKKVLPDHAQDIYRHAFNAAWREYNDPIRRRNRRSREELSARVAWNAVKTTYTKGRSGRWRLIQPVRFSD